MRASFSPRQGRASARPKKDYRSSHMAPDRGHVYDAKYRCGANRLYWEHFERPYLEQIFARISDDDHPRYLDFACGTGRIIGVACKYCAEAVGVDISPSMLTKARVNVPQARFLCADVVESRLDLGQFDAITLFRFLLNAQPQLRASVLDWLRGRLRNGGTLIVNNHCNAISLHGSIRTLKNRLGVRKPRSVLTDGEIRTLLANHGFRVVEQIGFKLAISIKNHTVLPGVVLTRLERMLFRLSAFQKFMENQIYLCQPE